MDKLNKRTQEALIRGTVWAFIGSLYGMIFIFFFNLSEHWLSNISPLLVAGTLAGTLAALIYSSMSLAVIIASVSSITCLIYVVSSGNHINLPYLILTTAIVGAITGSVYALKAKKSRIYRADAKTLTGLCSGGLVSILFFIVSLLIPSLPLSIIVGLSCLLTGTVYVFLAPVFVQRFDDILPPAGDGAMAGAGTSVFIALLFFVMITGVTPEIAGDLESLTENIRHSFLQAALGGLLGGGISGFISGLMLKEWQDL
jgi:hypothetical protein